MSADLQQILQQGLAHHEAGRLDEALACYGEALDVNPEFFEAYGLMGLALDVQARHAEAEICYRKALELRPDVPEIQLALGNVLRVQKSSMKPKHTYIKASVSIRKMSKPIVHTVSS